MKLITSSILSFSAICYSLPYSYNMNYHGYYGDLEEIKRTCQSMDVDNGFATNLDSKEDSQKSAQNRVIFILDKTGSMRSIEEETKSNYNEFLEDQKMKLSAQSERLSKGLQGKSLKENEKSENEDEVLVTPKPSKIDRIPKYTQVQFSTTLSIENEESILLAKKLNSENYKIGGSTALYDAIGCTIENFKNEKFNILVIVTDGQENASQIYNSGQVKELLEEVQEKQKWVVQYLGANQDAMLEGDRIGVNHARQSVSGNFVANSAGMKKMMNRVSSELTEQMDYQYDAMMDYYA